MTFIIAKYELIEKALIFRDFINPSIMLCILGVIDILPVIYNSIRVILCDIYNLE